MPGAADSALDATGVGLVALAPLPPVGGAVLPTLVATPQTASSTTVVLSATVLEVKLCWVQLPDRPAPHGCRSRGAASSARPDRASALGGDRARAHAVRCPGCRQRTRASFPIGRTGRCSSAAAWRCLGAIHGDEPRRRPGRYPPPPEAMRSADDSRRQRNRPMAYAHTNSKGIEYCMARQRARDEVRQDDEAHIFLCAGHPSGEGR